MMLEWFRKKPRVPTVEPGTQELLRQIGDEIEVGGITLGIAYVGPEGTMFSIAPTDCPRIRLPRPGEPYYSPPFHFAPLPKSRKDK